MSETGLPGAGGPEISGPEISVIVPHYNDLVRLDRCLSALMSQSLASDRFEIIVADNMSPVGEEVVRDVIAGRARLVMAPERGAGPARNAGVKAAGGTFLAFTDADCVPDAGWLAGGLPLLDRFDIVGGRMNVLVEGPRPMSGAEAFETVFAFDNKTYVEKRGFTVTANLFCRRSTFEAVGPFCTDMSEDIEWCERAGKMGLTIGYAEKAAAAHPARANWRELWRKTERVNSERFRLARTHRHGRLRWALASLLLPASIVLHAPAIFAHPGLTTNRERFAALATLMRLRLARAVHSQRLLLKG